MTSQPMMMSSAALLRYRRLNLFDARVDRGMSVSAAVHEVAALALDGETVDIRTLYRWLRRRKQGLEALNNHKRPQLEGSLVLDDEVITFFIQQKDRDPAASVPELIDRARQSGLVHPEADICRSTVWRTLKRVGVDTRRKAVSGKDTRRFAYTKRLQLVMADFKAFRAGPSGHKRLALYFMDDATRYILGVSVTSDGESTDVVLNGVHAVLSRYGRFDMLYLDNGPGFKANLLTETLARLNPPIPVILGTAGYPEGRGKIERFNRSLKARTLRHFRKPDIDPHLDALNLRLRHDVRVYNQRPHQSLQNRSPQQAWEACGRPLRPVGDALKLREVFTEPIKRTVSKDHVVSVDGVQYELPMGYAKTEVSLHRRILEPGKPLFIAHRDELLRLHPVDLAANAAATRTQHEGTPEAPEGSPTVSSAAEMSFAIALRPLVDANGGCKKEVCDED